MSDDESAYSLDDTWLRRSFDRASGTYDAAAVLQRDVREQLLERLLLTELSPRVVLDVGSATGHASRSLKRRYPQAHVVALDASPGMLRAAAPQHSWLRPFSRVCASVERLPLPDGCVDLVFSNLALQWHDLDAAFGECRRVLSPRGLLSFATLGPDTLRELRQAWHAVDARSRVNQFIDMHDIGDALVRAGFAAPVLDVDRYTLMYDDVRHLAADLKAIGAVNATRGRPRGLTGARRFAAMEGAYERSRTDGKLPATYEVVFGQAWAPAGGGSRSTGGDTEISLDQVRRQLQSRRGP